MAMKSVAPSGRFGVDVVNVDDAGVIQGGGRFRLLHKAALALGAGSGIWAQHLDGDGTVEMGIESPIHNAHAALAELGIYPVMAQRLADHSGSPMRLSQYFHFRFPTLGSIHPTASEWGS